MKLLCISNGHGEDAIAVQILQAFAQLPTQPDRFALPLVGEGNAYRRAGIPIIGEVKTLPSGGFVYMDAGQLLRDMRGGLVGLTWQQWRSVRQWVQTHRATSAEPLLVLAVGDIVPLLFAWASGAPYGFVGTAKSEYYLRDSQGQFLGARRWEGWSGSVYLPWERWLMGRSRCRGLFPRDTLTAQILRRWLPDRTFDCGNPMMDGFTGDLPDCTWPEPGSPLRVLLLPGSRFPEALNNWQRMLTALQAWPDLTQRVVMFQAAIAPGIDRAPLQQALQQAGWRSSTGEQWHCGLAQLELASDRFWDWAKAAHFAIATAGTATEQVVGLGKPAITLSGNGPQFTPAFAEAQTRLLGPSVTWIQEPTELPGAIEQLLRDPTPWQAKIDNGRQRLGPPGAARRIAEQLLNLALNRAGDR
jgi:uncharacterized protein (TIGR03492 family)